MHLTEFTQALRLLTSSFDQYLVKSRTCCSSDQTANPETSNLEYFSENFDIKISTKQKRAKNADKNIWLFENEHSLS